MIFVSTRTCEVCRANGFVGRLIHKRRHNKRFSFSIKFKVADNRAARRRK